MLKDYNANSFWIYCFAWFAQVTKTCRAMIIRCGLPGRFVKSHLSRMPCDPIGRMQIFANNALHVWVSHKSDKKGSLISELD